MEVKLCPPDHWKALRRGATEPRSAGLVGGDRNQDSEAGLLKTPWLRSVEGEGEEKR